MLYDGAHGPAWPPEEPDAYAASLKRLRTLPVSRVYPGHYGPFGEARMRELIDEQLAALAQLA
jgi:glyoxylase-like metal-dependent hydrolase (beta-lactamase superfamily II)